MERIHYSDRYSDDNYEYRHVRYCVPVYILSITCMKANANGTSRSFYPKVY